VSVEPIVRYRHARRPTPPHRCSVEPETLSYGGKVPEHHDLPMPQFPGEGDELPPPTEPVADNSVRVAWAADAEAIGAVQLRAWTHSYANVLPSELLNQLTAGEIAEVWTQAMIRPPTARRRVLVALHHGSVVGFAATAPAEDPDAGPEDGEIAAFHIDPAAHRSGHGSRLLMAAADTLRADGFSRALLWVVVGDDDLRAFLEPAGWAPDSAHRTLDLDEESNAQLRQIRLHTELTQENAAEA